MRWTKHIPEDGALRKVTGFLWFPKTIGLETRWLEHANWLDCYCSIYGWGAWRWLGDVECKEGLDEN
jgi:hypothetical protein